MGRLEGSFTRHLATTSRMALEKCFLPLSCSSVGGGFWIVISSTCHQATQASSQRLDVVAAAGTNASMQYDSRLHYDDRRRLTAGACRAKPWQLNPMHALYSAEHLHGREACKGRMPMGQLQHRDPKGPDVCQCIVPAEWPPKSDAMLLSGPL